MQAYKKVMRKFSKLVLKLLQGERVSGLCIISRTLNNLTMTVQANPQFTGGKNKQTSSSRGKSPALLYKCSLAISFVSHFVLADIYQPNWNESALFHHRFLLVKGPP